jgi:hypothetical protein
MIATFIFFAIGQIVKKVLLSIMIFNKQYSYILKNIRVMRNLLRKIATLVLSVTEDQRPTAIPANLEQDNKKTGPGATGFITYYRNVPVADTKCI